MLRARAAIAAGVDHIDTAQYDGPGVVNDLIREALYPYPEELAIVSKVAVRRDGSGAVRKFDDPDQLREGIQDNLRSLRVAQLAAVNLRLPGDGRVNTRFDDQLAAMVAARDEGLIAGIGLSNISLEQLQHAVARTEIVCVQNLFHLADRTGAPLLAECLSRGIALVLFLPARLAARPGQPRVHQPGGYRGQQPGSASRPRRWRSSGCCGWPPTSCSSPGPAPSPTCGKTWPPRTSPSITRR